MRTNNIRWTWRIVIAAGWTLAMVGVPRVTGETPAPPRTTDAVLQALVAEALTNNASLRASGLRWEAARQKVAQAGGWPDPKLTYGYFAQPVETRVGPQEHRIGVMQPFVWFGRLKAAGDVASRDAAALLAEHEAARLSVVQQVKETWYEIHFLERATAITRDNIDLLKQVEAVAQAQFRAGGSMSSVTKAQVELGKLQDRLSSLQQMRDPLVSRMNSILNRSQDSPMPSAGVVFADRPPLPSVGQLMAWQEEASPLLAASEQRVRREEDAIRVARKNGMPGFGLGVDYIVTGPARTAGISDSGKDAVIAMLSVDIPLWRGKYKAAVSEAEARRDAADAALLDQGNQLATQLQMAIYHHRDAERKAGLYSATLVPQARSALNVARQSYETGAADFLNLIDAQRVLLEFEFEHQRALANREQARARIELLVGRTLEPEHSTAPQETQP